MKYLEAPVTVVALLSMWFGIQRNPLTWPITIAVTLINSILLYERRLYHACIVNAVGLITSFYGWHKWKRDYNRHTQIRIVRTSKKGWLSLIFAGFWVGFLLYSVLCYSRANTRFTGTLSAVLTLVGLWMTANRRLESYWIWVVKNVIEMWNCYEVKLYWFSFKYAVYLAASIYGSLNWYSAYRAQIKRQAE